MYKRNTKLRILANFLLFLCLSGVVVSISIVAYLSSKGLDIKSMSFTDIRESLNFYKKPAIEGDLVGGFSYKQAERPVFVAYKGYIVKCGNDSIKFIDKNGEIKFEKNIPLQNPVVKTNGNELLVAEIGSRDINVFKDKELKWSAKLEGSIINADISEAGYVSVTHDVKGYRSGVTVFNLQGTPFFTRNIIDNLALSTIVSKKGQFVGISALDTSGISSKSTFEVTDILGSPVGEKIININDLSAQVYYLDGDILAAAGNSSIYGVDKKNKEAWNFVSQPEKILTTAKIDSKNIIAVLESDSKKINEDYHVRVVRISYEGKPLEIFKGNKQLKNVDVGEGIVALNFKDEVKFISNTGRDIGTYNSKADIERVVFLNSEEAAIITKTAVEIIKI